MYLGLTVRLVPVCREEYLSLIREIGAILQAVGGDHVGVHAAPIRQDIHRLGEKIKNIGSDQFRLGKRVDVVRTDTGAGDARLQAGQKIGRALVAAV